MFPLTSAAHHTSFEEIWFGVSRSMSLPSRCAQYERSHLRLKTCFSPAAWCGGSGSGEKKQLPLSPLIFLGESGAISDSAFSLVKPLSFGHISFRAYFASKWDSFPNGAEFTGQFTIFYTPQSPSPAPAAWYISLVSRDTRE